MLDARLAVAAALLLAPCLASANEPTMEVEATPVSIHSGPKNMISVAPISILFGAFGAEYERVVADPLSLTFNADYRWSEGFRDMEGAPSVGSSVVGLNVGAHLFLMGKAPSGLWLGPEIGTLVEATGDGTRLGAVPRFAMQLGYTGLIADVLSISVGAGVQMISVLPLPSLRMSLGLAF